MDGGFIRARRTNPLGNTHWPGSEGTSSGSRSGTDRGPDPSGRTVYFSTVTRSSPGAYREWSVGNDTRGGRLDCSRLPRRQLASAFSPNRPAIAQDRCSPFHLANRGRSASESATDRKKDG